MTCLSPHGGRRTARQNCFAQDADLWLDGGGGRKVLVDNVLTMITPVMGFGYSGLWWVVQYLKRWKDMLDHRCWIIHRLARCNDICLDWAYWTGRMIFGSIGCRCRYVNLKQASVMSNLIQHHPMLFTAIQPTTASRWALRAREIRSWVWRPKDAMRSV